MQGIFLKMKKDERVIEQEIEKLWPFQVDFGIFSENINVCCFFSCNVTSEWFCETLSRFGLPSEEVISSHFRINIGLRGAVTRTHLRGPWAFFWPKPGVKSTLSGVWALETSSLPYNLHQGNFLRQEQLMCPFLGDPMGTPKAKIKLKILKILKNVKIQQKMEVFKPKSTKKAEIYQILS